MTTFKRGTKILHRTDRVHRRHVRDFDRLWMRARTRRLITTESNCSQVENAEWGFTHPHSKLQCSASFYVKGKRCARRGVRRPDLRIAMDWTLEPMATNECQNRLARESTVLVRGTHMP
eukprot:6190753-Pleurochrysis_carterae.AAC.2